MAGKLHKSLVEFCKQKFPELIDGDRLRVYHRRENCQKGTPIPDLSSADKTLAIECHSFNNSEVVLNRLRRTAGTYQKTILVLPLIKGISEIWMYNSFEGIHYNFELKKG